MNDNKKLPYKAFRSDDFLQLLKSLEISYELTPMNAIQQDTYKESF